MVEVAVDEPSELVKEAESDVVELDTSIADALEIRFVLVGTAELFEEARSVEVEESVEDALDDGSLVGPWELVKEAVFAKLEDPIENMLEGTVLVESTELDERREPVGVDDSGADTLERLADDEGF